MKDLFWKSPSSTPGKINRYERFGLKRNPFPVDPCVKPGSENDLENGKIYLEDLRKNEESQFEKLLIHRKDSSEAKKIALLMDFAAFRGRGIGKTAFLNHQLNRINGDFGYSISGGNETICAVYVRPGGDKNERKFWQISKLIFESMYEQHLLHVALSRIRVFSKLIPDELLEGVTIENLNDTVLSDEWLKANNIDIAKLNMYCKQAIIKEGVDSDLAGKFNYLAMGKDTFYSHFADKPDSYWRSNENKILYNDLVKLFRLAGFSACVILFDESEKVITVQNFQERRMFCDNLRYFYFDGNAENVSSPFFRLLLTVHPYSQELLNPHWSASGLNRFVELGGESARHYTIYFTPLNEESAIPLAGLYLKESRVDQNEQNNNAEAQNILPFTKDALQNILVKAEGIPGRYLQFLYLAIENAISEKWDTIGSKEIARVITTDLSLKEIEESLDNTLDNKTEIDLNR